MLITYKETFGPVAPIIPFESDEEVIQLANKSQFGLASYFYSRDIGRIWKVAEALEYGMVGVNTGLISNEVVPLAESSNRAWVAKAAFLVWMNISK